MNKYFFIILLYIPCYFSLFLNETTCGDLIDFHDLNKCHIVIINEYDKCECLTCNLGATKIEINNTVHCLDQNTPGYEKLKHCREALYNTYNKECADCEYGYTVIDGECKPKMLVDNCKEFAFNYTLNISVCVECNWQFGGPFDDDNPPINGQCPPKCSGDKILEFNDNNCIDYPKQLTRNCLDYDSKKKECKDCVDGYFLDDKGRCRKFKDGCKMGREDYCAECFEGYYFDWERKCRKCPDNCISCNEYYVCYEWKNNTRRKKRRSRVRRTMEVENGVSFLKKSFIGYLLMVGILVF